MSDQIRLTRPTIAASHGIPLRVGKSVYKLPSGSRVAHPHNAKKLAYVIDWQGVVHCFVETGEVTLSQPLQQIIRRKFFSGG